MVVITPPSDNAFIYKSSVKRSNVKSIFKIDDPATSVYILKLKLKTNLLNKKLLGSWKFEMLKIGLKTILFNY